MLITSLQGKSSLLDLAWPSDVSSASDDSVGGSFFRLMTSIASGDTTSAQKYLGQFEENAHAQNLETSPIQQVLSDVRSALSVGDIPAAEAALSTLQAGVSQSPASIQVSSLSGADVSAGSGVSELGDKVLSLFSAITSGDLQSAQSAYGSLTRLLPSNNSPFTYSASFDTQNASLSDFGNLRSKVESALDSGNISSAEAAMQDFLQEFSTGSIVRTVA
jgi:hypothetical protein